MPRLESTKEEFVVHENCGVRIYGYPVTLTTNEGEEVRTEGCLVISKCKPHKYGSDDLNKHRFAVHVEVDVSVSAVKPIQWGDKNRPPSSAQNEDNIEESE